jgi:UDP-GlcNAc:undecaprenyl-phosphate GlcNAc-1-phosphate transferase
LRGADGGVSGGRSAGNGSGMAGSANTLAAAGLGAAVALLPEDLGERAMLGDAGANALGALLGLAAVAGARSTAGLAWRAAALTAVTLASEKVSFTKVIAGWPPLNAVDLWGRRPAASVSATAAPLGYRRLC